MDPITAISLVGGAIVFLKEWNDDQKKKKAEQPTVKPLQFTPEQIQRFTHQRGDARYFDRKYATEILHSLRGRSVMPAQSRELSRWGQIWQIVPYKPELVSAAEIISQAQAQNHSVLGSLSLIAMNLGREYPLVIVTGEVSIEQLAGQRSHFGVLDSSTLRVVAKPEVNGAAKEAPAAVVEPKDAPVARE